MTNIIEAIVFIVMGVAITLTGILTGANLEVICLGGVITIMAIVALIINLTDKNRIKKSTHCSCSNECKCTCGELDDIQGECANDRE